MLEPGRILIVAGVALVIAGLIAVAPGRLPWSLGRLPGDLTWQGRNWRVSFALGTSLLLSVLLSVFLWAVTRFR